jgi:hypothetical protein
MGLLDIPPQEIEPRRRVNWGAVAAVITIVGWMLGAASGFFGDYKRVGERVTILETLRETDALQRERMELKLDKLDDKMDRIIEQRPRK